VSEGFDEIGDVVSLIPAHGDAPRTPLVEPGQDCFPLGCPSGVGYLILSPPDRSGAGGWSLKGRGTGAVSYFLPLVVGCNLRIQGQHMKRCDFIRFAGSAAPVPLAGWTFHGARPTERDTDDWVRLCPDVRPHRRCLRGFHRGLKEEGFIEAQDLAVEYR
jgi:hypothetical protein